MTRNATASEYAAWEDGQDLPAGVTLAPVRYVTRYTDLVLTVPCSDPATVATLTRWTEVITRALDFRAESWSGLTVGIKSGFFTRRLTIKIDSVTATEAGMAAFTSLFDRS